VPCIEDGELTPAGRALLQALSEPRTDKEIREITGQRLFRVRINLRELLYAGLASSDGERFMLTEKGRAEFEKLER
jgi:predicted transcriptional regulator